MKRNETLAARSEPSPDRLAVPRGVWGDELNDAAREELRWLWPGYLAAGNLTLLTSQWKSGKTTLVSLLLARRHLASRGGEPAELAGLPVAAGRTAVVSEESLAHWHQRRRKADFGRDVCFFCRPFRGKPTTAQWQALLDRLTELHTERGVDLVVIDPLAAFLPGRDESHAGLMLEALLPLQQLTARGVAVLLLHHPRKGESAPGQAARGSGALAGYADVVVEMNWYGFAAEHNRRRRLLAYSRYEETPRQLVLELNAEGTDYLNLGDGVQEEFASRWERLRWVLEEAPGKLTRKQILRMWPEDPEPPSEASLWRWLAVAVAKGWVRQEGTGRRNDPMVFWLPGKEREELFAPFWPEVAEQRQLLKEAKEKLQRFRRHRSSEG